MQQSRAASSSHSQSRVPSPSPSRPQSRPPSLSVVVPPTRPTSPTLTPASASDSGASSILPPEPEAGPSTPPPVVQKPATATPPPPQPAVSGRLKIGNSPVTRSRCRFHKISLPREENGPRIYFVVPGCSLSDKELMKEEEIVDHGVPSFPQGTKLLADIDHLKLNPYMLGVLRQLVGVDLLREQEVFYLPQEGEEYAWKPKRQHKHTVSKAKLSARGRKSIGAPIQSAPDSNGIAESISAARAYSRAGSVSTVSSRQSRRGRASGRSSVAYSASVAGSDLSELSEDEEPPSKRRKTESGSSPPAEVEGDKEASASQASAVAPRRLSKRSKRLGKDASAYKPDPEDVVDVSDDESGPSTKRKKRGKQRGTKRSRSDEPTEETVVETAPPKRRRTRKKAIQEANGEDK
ncbi:uncharacterized protein B0H18DRAFT_1019011 [Fomitopsis serialis]|uniref:uncharacterized protein n=1 Tax=Fomitopsis serialis TaxID=139415 RepID=UPI00200846B5|nr:uncharacterized protein B0H18DRAFT_1019011 [Neoantrodia serialis]KAH9922070.1 hypothetical protein B0H18DRAFT_1019011 [Neoantrodia serialis]